MTTKGYLDINHVKVYYEHHGQPKESGHPVLIMIHGYLSSSFSFRLLIPHLQKKFSIYCLDLPGFGQSEKSLTFHYSLKSYGELILAFINHLELKRVNLIGHSMGGQIALQAAYFNSMPIQKIILLSASGYLGKINRSLVFLSYLPFFSFGLRRYFTKKDVVKTFLEVVYDRSFVSEEMMTGYLTPINDPDFFKSLVRLIRHREGDLPSECLRKIQIPTLLLWGREDKIVPLSVGERLAEDLPQSKLKIYDETGHLVPEERAEEVASDIQAFI